MSDGAICPRCHNFLRKITTAGVMTVRCGSCEFEERIPELLLHATYRGKIPVPRSDEPNRMDERISENLSHDWTLAIDPLRKCERCGSALRLWLGADGLYRRTCPQCKRGANGSRQ